jgi:CTP-dependent riboflavin kinase
VIALSGVVASGAGRAAGFVAIPWVSDEIRRVLSFVPYPGTLNVRLDDADALRAWRTIRDRPGLVLTPPPPEPCGARLYSLVVAPGVAAAVIVPDVTRYGDDTLEVVAAVHLRTRLGLRDGDRITLHVDAQVSRL